MTDLGKSGAIPQAAHGQKVLIEATIFYPGARVTDIAIGPFIVRDVPNGALRDAQIEAAKDVTE